MSENEPTPADIGANIVRAVGVLRETHREVSNLLGWLDEALGERGWGPIHVSSGTWVGLAMNGAQIGKPENWMATLLQRGYMRSGTPDEARERALLVEIDLAPERASVPVLAILAITFLQPLTPRQLWTSWTWQGSGSWRVACTEGIVELDPGALARLVAGGSGQARGLVVPLCELDRRNIETRLLDAALALAP